ncbi:MAG TPA: amidohydrolase/deacetylase family metallohydrolase [Acetobacteraceae bacterium]|jgi:dihydroorotase|nr:amidohydrolase/deacetylase family metallohydrolase [Acetobacteraceae bacterium]
MHDLILTGGRVLDPAADRDEAADVAFAGGRVAAVGRDLGAAKETRDVAGKLVVPGLIDLHTHVYWGGTSLGVDADNYAKPCGITTLVDAGSAGPGNFAGFRRHVIERAEVRILPFLHISFPGIFGVSKYFSYGESSDLMMLDPRAFLDVAREHKDLVVGAKVRIGKVGSGAVGAGALAIALEAAEHSGLPLMTHLDRPPPHRSEVMPKLRRGDIWTHCFRGFPNAPLTYDGEIQDDIMAARERGVIFDIGHGRGSFGFATARKMLEHGFSPDVLSSDVHVMSVNGPAFNLLVTMSKFLALGFPLREIIRTCTINPARAVGKADRGTLQPGLLGDATVLDIEDGAFEFVDAPGERIKGDRQFVCRGAVLGGKWWH